MKRRILSSWVVASIALITLAVARASADELPPAATGRVDFNTQIKPMLQGRCLTCHARGKFKGGLSLETRESLLRGGEEGPAAVVGKSGESHLVRLIAGLEEGRRMPQKGPALSREEIGLFRAWIDQGLAWPTGLSFGFRQAPLAPRNPELPAPPAGVSLESPIDRLIAGSLAKQGVTLDWNPTDDRAFARRVSLDLVGLLPSRDRLAKFEQDESLR